MSNIFVYLDTSKSMTTDAKPLIQKTIIETLTFLPKIEEEFSDISFKIVQAENGKWDVNKEDKYLFITDGFIDNKESFMKNNKNIAFVLIGEDSDLSVLKKYKNTFQACSVIKAVSYLKDLC